MTPISDGMANRAKYEAMKTPKLTVEVALKLDTVLLRLDAGDKLFATLRRNGCPALMEQRCGPRKVKKVKRQAATIWIAKAKIVTGVTGAIIVLLLLIGKVMGVY